MLNADALALAIRILRAPFLGPCRNTDNEQSAHRHPDERFHVAPLRVGDCAAPYQAEGVEATGAGLFVWNEEENDSASAVPSIRRERAVCLQEGV
jgi:hypothetical protein